MIKKILISLGLLSGCSKDENFDINKFVNNWWEITETPNKYNDYEDTYCFYLDGNHIFYLVNFVYGYGFIYSWERLDLNKFEIIDGDDENVFTATVNENFETIETSWTIKLNGFLSDSKIIAIECPESTLLSSNWGI